jgi:bifunctional DNase/RNase
MIPVELVKIIIDEKNHDQAVVLRELKGSRQIPIVIGLVEATSIQMRIAGIETPRPLTHDLLASVLQSLEAVCEFLLIDDIVSGTFFAKLHLKNKQGLPIVVDCRPSDGIAIAVRLNIPMFVEEKIFEKAVSKDL